MVVNVNLNGSYLCAREVYSPMVEQGGGKIINIGSMTSIFGSDWVAAYSASKGGVVQMTKSLAVAWAKDNIQVNSILPGWIHTNLTSAIKTEDAGALRLHHIPDPPRTMGRAGRACGNGRLPSLQRLGLRHRRVGPGRRRLQLVLASPGAVALRVDSIQVADTLSREAALTTRGRLRTHGNR